MYLDTALGRFLLKRALLNKRIGHTLFWHLRYMSQVLLHLFGICTAVEHCYGFMVCMLCTVAVYACMRSLGNGMLLLDRVCNAFRDCLSKVAWLVACIYTHYALCTAQLVGLVCVIGLLLHAELTTNNFTPNHNAAMEQC